MNRGLREAGLRPARFGDRDEFGEDPVDVGDAIAPAASTLWGSQNEEPITVTPVHLDSDHTIDQVLAARRTSHL